MSAPTFEDLEQPRGEPAPELLDGRIWVDGCWDFFHHGETSIQYLPCCHWLCVMSLLIYLAWLLGHAGAMVQARQLGDELYVGVHSDESILANKGPTVMDLDERYVHPIRGKKIQVLIHWHAVSQLQMPAVGSLNRLAMRPTSRSSPTSRTMAADTLFTATTLRPTAMEMTATASSRRLGGSR